MRLRGNWGLAPASDLLLAQTRLIPLIVSKLQPSIAFHTQKISKRLKYLNLKQEAIYRLPVILEKNSLMIEYY